MIKITNYIEQEKSWPLSGRHILAQYDEKNIVVYQAYRPAIGHFAAQHQTFGGDFSYSRMSWIKPNFLWMMYRSGWGTKEGQEVSLAITIPRSFFDSILESAVFSSFQSDIYSNETEWKDKLQSSDVRLQWDPDHAPDGTPLQRRAVQLGLRGDILKQFGKESIVSIRDISGFVAQQKQYLDTRGHPEETPQERVYIPQSADARQAIGLNSLSSNKTSLLTS